MPLVLRPLIKDFSREELLEHVEKIRTRRMSIAFEYHTQQQLKLETGFNRIQRKYSEHLNMLGRELETLDKAIAKVEKRVDLMTALSQEDGLLRDMLDNLTVESQG